MKSISIVVVLAALLMTSCSTTSTKSEQTLGPSAPSGATIIPGGPMESTRVGKNPKIPTSQQEAQDAVLGYLKQTINIMPSGSDLDGARYRIGKMTRYCEDDPSGPDAPVHVEDWRDVNLPPGTDFNAMISQTGETWKKWGWHVIERDGFEKPNRFGYTPDGYVLHLEARNNVAATPFLIGSSPCFPGNLRRDIPWNPPVITQSAG